ncbi:hypothetical protein BH09GEM1_BH09GEM1_31800 [soil metagenome]
MIATRLRRSAALATIAMTAAATLGAQTAQIQGTTHSTIVASDPGTGPSDGYNNPIYQASRAPGSDYSGIAVLWFRDAGGAVRTGCTGSYLGAGKILTAAHCVSNGSAITSSSFTARFFQTGLGWVDVNGTGYAVKSGYSGAVIEENDVAVLTLASAAPSFARTYSLATGTVLGNQQTFSGYGLTGTGVTGDVVSDNIFNNAADLRTGLNKFESTCTTAGSCATAVNPTPGDYGGVLLSDFDQSGVSSPGFMCTNLGFCDAGYGGYAEVGIGSGDSGSASFNSNWTITGVASFGQTNNSGVGSFYGYYNGYTCVANVGTNAACSANYAFVASQLPVVSATPEPATVTLMATGLFAVAGFARRRRKA